MDNLVRMISNSTGVEDKIVELFITTIIFWSLLEILKRLLLNYFKGMDNDRKSYHYAQRTKIFISLSKFIAVALIWSSFIGNLLTLISVLSAAFTIALRDLIWNYFCGIYIRLTKPFEIEDRIEINNFKGDVVNLKGLSFELLEVNNEAFIGQSTGVITHVPNSVIFSHSLRNYNKAFKYIWDEIVVNIPLDQNLDKTKAVLYRIINNNDVIKDIPENLKRDLNEISNDYRIYYNQYEPIIYTKVIGDYVQYSVRYLVHPKRARYVNSSIWKHILYAYQNGELVLYNKNYEYKNNDIVIVKEDTQKKTRKKKKEN
jgi:small-conductance mechanosensitive channel